MKNMKVEWVDVTPEMALKWLQENPENFRDEIGPLTVRYTSDMENGRWGTCVQDIIFNEKGRLIDGRHRLRAVFLSGKTVRFPIKSHAPLGSERFIDIGKGRTPENVYKHDHPDHEGVNFRIPLAMAIYRGPEVRGSKKSGSSGCQSVILKMQLAERFEKPMTWTMAQFPKHTKGIFQSMVLAAIARAYMRRDVSKERLAAFCVVLSTGVTDSQNDDQAAIILRDWLLKGDYKISKKVAGRNLKIAKSNTIYCKTQRALASFLDRKPLIRLYEEESDLFPLDSRWKGVEYSANQDVADTASKIPGAADVTKIADCDGDAAAGGK